MARERERERTLAYDGRPQGGQWLLVRGSFEMEGMGWSVVMAGEKECLMISARERYNVGQEALF